MKHLGFALLVVLSTLYSCDSNKIDQGEILYSISYPDNNASGFTLALLPDEMNLTFKDTRVLTTVKKGKLFSTQILTNESDKSVEMRLQFSDEHLIYSALSESDAKKLKDSQPVYTFSTPSSEDSLAGLLAKKYEITCGAGSEGCPQEAWFTEDLIPQNPFWFTSYSGINGVPLVYDVVRYGIRMRFTAVSFTPREVLDSEFERNPDLNEVDFDQYESTAQELFDILM